MMEREYYTISDSANSHYDDIDCLEGIINSENNSSIKGDISLWRAVITQALMDAGSNSKKMEMRKAKAEAISWLSGSCDDFETVCSYAHLNPDYVKTKAKYAIARGCVWRELNPNSFIKNRKNKTEKKGNIGVINIKNKNKVTGTKYTKNTYADEKII